MGTVYIAICNLCRQPLETFRIDNHSIRVNPCGNKECFSNKEKK